jgi:hypothetical protein
MADSFPRPARHQPEPELRLNHNPAYRETVTRADGAADTGDLTAWQADRLLATAVRRGYAIDPGTDGSIRIRRPSTGATVLLTPTHRPTPSERQAADLELLRDRPGRVRNHAGRITLVAGLAGIPAQATERLISRGWVSALVLDHGVEATLSSAGLVALALHQHRTRTTTPRGWHRLADDSRFAGHVGRDRHGGRVYDGSSTALCSCGWSYRADSRAIASRAAAAHRTGILAETLTETARHLLRRLQGRSANNRLENRS